MADLDDWELRRECEKARHRIEDIINGDEDSGATRLGYVIVTDLLEHGWIPTR